MDGIRKRYSFQNYQVTSLYNVSKKVTELQLTEKSPARDDGKHLSGQVELLQKRINELEAQVEIFFNFIAWLLFDTRSTQLIINIL